MREESVEVKVNNRDGSQAELSGILIVHLLKGYPGIYSVASEQMAEGHLAVKISSPVRLDTEAIKTFFLKEIAKDHPDIDADVIEVVQTLQEDKTIAGKEKIA